MQPAHVHDMRAEYVPADVFLKFYIYNNHGEVLSVRDYDDFFCC